MKVYVKNKNIAQDICRYVVPTILFLVSIFIFYLFFTYDGTLIESLLNYGLELLFAICFFITGIICFSSIFMKPKVLNVKLMFKQVLEYKGREITYMEFNLKEDNPQNEIYNTSEYSCYSFGQNNLVVGNYYSLKIKRFNELPIFVGYPQEVVTSIEKENRMSLLFLKIMFSFIFGGAIMLCGLAIIIYPEYILAYILSGALFTYILLIINKLL